ncbi:MAG: hypothetical protein ACUVRK_12865 [Spirochaetota bacterium]
MKKIIIMIITILAGATIAMANLYVDGLLMLNNAGDAKTQSGVGLNIATSIRDDINIFFRQTLSHTTKDPNTINQIDYMQIQWFLGGEYVYSIKQYPIAITLSAAAGVSHTEVRSDEEIPGVIDIDLAETGIGYGFWLGGQWMLTQLITPFIEIGYSKSMYTNDFKNANIGGLQFLAGIRFTIWGKNKSLSDEYE